MDDANIRGQDADRIGDELRQRCCQTLAVRARADPRLDLAGGVHHDLHGFPARRDLHAARGKSRTAVSGALGEARKANSEKAALRAGGAITHGTHALE